MNVKDLITLLNFVTLVVALLLGASIYNYECFRCGNTVAYLQFLDMNAYGLAIITFVVIIAFFVKEEIPPKIQLMISFLSGILYFCTTVCILMLYLKDYETIRMLIALIASALLTALHLTVGVVCATKKRE